MEESKYDFKIIFDEVEKLKSDKMLTDNFVSEDQIEHDRAIYEFGEICNQISQDSSPVVFTTFS